MIITVLYNMAGKPNVTTTDTTWYAKGRVWSMQNGVSDGTDLEANITREQLTTMLWRRAGAPAMTDDKGLDDFTDANDISAYAQQAMAWAHKEGIIKGRGNSMLDPKGMATRAEVATMVVNYYNSVK